MKKSKIIIQFTETEDGQLAKDLENIIKNDIESVSKSRQKKPTILNN